MLKDFYTNLQNAACGISILATAMIEINKKDLFVLICVWGRRGAMGQLLTVYVYVVVVGVILTNRNHW